MLFYLLCFDQKYRNLKIIKPEFVVHGDDWKKGVQKQTRKDVFKV